MRSIPPRYLRQVVVHTITLSTQIVNIVSVGLNLDGRMSRSVNAKTAQTTAFVRIISQKIGRLNPQVPQNLPSHGVLAGIFWKALFQVSVNGIKARVLQAVGLKLRQEADAAPFVSTQVDDDAAAGFLDFLRR